jgi:hypothetical protein
VRSLVCENPEKGRQRKSRKKMDFMDLRLCVLCQIYKIIVLNDILRFSDCSCLIELEEAPENGASSVLDHFESSNFSKISRIMFNQKRHGNP